MSSASISSELVSPSPTSEPSKYNDQVPVVLGPKVVGVNCRISSSAAPLTPVTVGLPVVEINKLPFGRTLRASMFSLDAVKSTSAPLKYILNVPAVLLPSEVASNRAMSVGANAIPFSVMALLKDMRSESASRL